MTSIYPYLLKLWSYHNLQMAEDFSTLIWQTSIGVCHSIIKHFSCDRFLISFGYLLHDSQVQSLYLVTFACVDVRSFKKDAFFIFYFLYFPILLRKEREKGKREKAENLGFECLFPFKGNSKLRELHTVGSALALDQYLKLV